MAETDESKDKKEEQSATTALVSAGQVLMKLENNDISSLALQNPRDEDAILDAALKELERYPTMAEEAIYRKPVGKARNPETGNYDGDPVYAEGLSIRAIESLFNRWGNSAWGITVVNETDDDVELAFVYMDYELNKKTVIVSKVNKFYQTRDKKIKRHAPDRFSDLVLKAAQSKLIRDGGYRNLPPGLRKEYEKKAREIMMGQDSDLPLPERLEKMLAVFATYGLTKGDLEHIQGKGFEDFDMEDVVGLKATHNGLFEGEIKAEELKAKNPENPEASDAPLTAKKPEDKEPGGDG